MTVAMASPLALRLRAGVVGPLLQAPGRTALAVVAIALGVALGLAIHLINRSAADEVSLAARSLFGLADLTVEGTSAGFDESLFPRVARVPGVAVVSPVVEVEARLVGQRGTLTMLGLDGFRAMRMQPTLGLAPGGSGGAGMDPASAWLSPSAARATGLGPGGTLTVQVGLRPVSFRVGGLLPASAYRQRVAVLDIATAQWRLDRLGRVTRLDVRLEEGARPADVTARIRALLPPGVRVTTPGVQGDEALRLSRAYRSNLTALALVALFTGAFLVYSTQSLAVVRRRRELALMHALGVTAREQVALTLASSAIIGLCGATLGLALGTFVAGLGLSALGGDLGAGYFRGLAPELGVRPGDLLGFLALGIGVSLASTLGPAREAASVPAAAALKSGDADVPPARGHAVWGLVLLVLAACMLVLPPVSGLPLPGYIAIALTLIGAILLMPAVTGALGRVLPQAGPPTLSVAVAHLRGTARQATVSIAAVLVSFSLMVAMAIMVTSFRTSLDDWMHRILPADLYLRAGYTGQSAFLEPGVLERLAALPGVARLDSSRFGEARLVADGSVIAVIARPIDEADADRVLWLESSATGPAPADAIPAWLSESAADLHGLSPGDRFRVGIGEREVELSVRGVYRDYERQGGALVLDRAAWVRLTGDARSNTAWLHLEPGATAAEVIQAVRAALPAGAEYDLVEPGQIRALSLAIFDRTFAVTYILEAIAVLIGLFGISASVSAQVLARRAEFGMLRHVGFTRAQVGAMLGLEGAVLGAVGVAAGLVVGSIVSLILVFVVNRQSFHWSMDLHVPVGLLAVLSVSLVAASVLTAVWSGRQAMGDDAVHAVKEDW